MKASFIAVMTHDRPVRMIWAIAALAAGLITSPAAHANDSMAEVAIGGLVLKQSSDIAMDREELFISRDEVRVDYLFTNTGPNDIETLVAFPLPDQDLSDVMVVAHDMKKELKFRTTVDGKPVTYDIVLQAILSGKDVTAELAALGLEPDTPLNWDNFDARLKALPPEKLAAAAAAGLFSNGAGSATDSYEPNWKIRTTVTRRQVFPAGKTISVSHRYKPIAGGSVPGAYEAENRHQDWLAGRISTYCIEDSWFRAFDKARAQHPHTGGSAPPYMEHWLGYVLSSGANWKGPIKDFRLVIDKGKPDNLVSFCAEGVKKISPTQFEVRKTNFEPQDDIRVMIVEWDTPQ
jgi:hypothetical protein